MTDDKLPEVVPEYLARYDTHGLFLKVTRDSEGKVTKVGPFEEWVVGFLRGERRRNYLPRWVWDALQTRGAPYILEHIANAIAQLFEEEK